jgi:nitrite reductase/ring-hydroxylating ferredoxin subunit
MFFSSMELFNIIVKGHKKIIVFWVGKRFCARTGAVIRPPERYRYSTVTPREGGKSVAKSTPRFTAAPPPIMGDFSVM